MPGCSGFRRRDTRILSIRYDRDLLDNASEGQFLSRTRHVAVAERA